MDFIKSFNLNKYEFKEIIGSGTFAEVKLYQHKIKNNKNIAIKELKYDSEESRVEFIKEIYFLATLKHPCIISFYGLIEDNEGKPLDSYAYQYMKNGSLNTLFDDINLGLKNKNILGGTEKSIIAYGIALGMQYLHFNAIKNGQIIHRDLKSGNILLTNELYPKISDFGFIKIIRNENFHTQEKGSFSWMAPEVMISSNYGTPSDVYSFGMILYELLIEHIPCFGFNTRIEFIENIGQNGFRPELPLNI